METLSHARISRTVRFRLLLAFLLSAFLLPANAQSDVIDRLELAFANGASDSVIAELHGILRAPGTSRTSRFEACMLMAECWYQRQSMEQFNAWNDSAGTLLNSKDEERWARAEGKRCGYANFFVKPEQAIA